MSRTPGGRAGRGEPSPPDRDFPAAQAGRAGTLTRMFVIGMHSGAAFGGKAMFRRGLETYQMPHRFTDRLRRLGAITHDSYGVLEQLTDPLMYNDTDTFTLIPAAAGTFTHIDGFDAPVYLPTADEQSLLAAYFALVDTGTMTAAQALDAARNAHTGAPGRT